MGYYDSKASLTKAVVWFRDGNIRTFYSADRKHINSKPDMELGIERLQNLIVKWGSKVETAIIYNNQNGMELAKYKSGAKVN